MLSNFELYKRIIILEEKRDKLQKRLEKLDKKMNQLSEEWDLIDNRLQNLYVIEDQRGGQHTLEKQMEAGEWWKGEG